MNPLQVISSADGSSTLYHSDLNETYHSKHGAITESMHVFINNGFKRLSPLQRPVLVLEVGFGTGLNALLTFQQAKHLKVPVEYHVIEPYPIDAALTNQLNYEAALHDSILQGVLGKLHQADWEIPVQMDGLFTLVKYKTFLQSFQARCSFDIVYYDAFGPQKQPDMWTLENFRKLHDLLFPGGILVSYCASGQFKRNLKEAGFLYQSLSGPPGKKEMSFAVKPS